MAHISIDTGAKEEFIDITAHVDSELAKLGAADGFVHLMCMHTTAGLTVNENADPDVKSDMQMALERMVPDDPNFRHAEGNSTAHVKSSLMGISLVLPVSGGKLVLGRWQGVYFCEFDGPRQGRTVQLRILQ